MWKGGAGGAGSSACPGESRATSLLSVSKEDPRAHGKGRDLSSIRSSAGGTAAVEADGQVRRGRPPGERRSALERGAAGTLTTTRTVLEHATLSERRRPRGA